MLDPDGLGLTSIIFTHLLIAYKVVNIWKSFWKGTGVTSPYSNKKKAEDPIHKFPRRKKYFIPGEINTTLRAP